MKPPLGFWSWTNRLSKLEKVFDTVRICGSLFSLIFVSIAATALFIYILEHCSPEISLQRVKIETRMPESEICKTGALGVLSRFLILTPLLCELSSVNYLADAHCLSKELILPRFLVSPLFLCVTEWLIWTLVMTERPNGTELNVSFPSESSSILDMCCYLSTSSSVCDSATLMFPKRDFSFIYCSYI